MKACILNILAAFSSMKLPLNIYFFMPDISSKFRISYFLKTKDLRNNVRNFKYIRVLKSLYYFFKLWLDVGISKGVSDTPNEIPALHAFNITLLIVSYN